MSAETVLDIQSLGGGACRGFDMKNAVSIIALIGLLLVLALALLPHERSVLDSTTDSTARDVSKGVPPEAGFVETGTVADRESYHIVRRHPSAAAGSAGEAGAVMGEGESSEAPSTLEPTGDVGVDHLAKVIERAYTLKGGLGFRDPTDVRSREFLARYGVDHSEIAPEDLAALQALATQHDEAVFEASRAAFVELQTTYINMIERGNYIQYSPDSEAPIPNDVYQGATLGFVPGPQLFGARRVLVVSRENAPGWKSALEAEEAVRAAREAAFRRFLEAR